RSRSLTEHGAAFRAGARRSARARPLLGCAAMSEKSTAEKITAETSTAPKPRAVCLVSGGMDSAVTLAEARAAGFATYALTVRYGQRAQCELEAAARVARALGAADHRVVALDLAALGGSALVGA